MKRIIVVTLAVAVALVACVWIVLRFESVDIALYRRLATSAATAPIPQLAQKNELAVLLCGSGSPLPDRNRAAACSVIAAGEDLYVVDAGGGSVRNLLDWRMPLDKVAGVFITHFHSDHIADLGELRLQTWVAGRKTPLKVYGPPGIEQVVAGFNQAYALDTGYRTAHHGAAMLPPDAVPLVAVVVPMDASGRMQLLAVNGLTVTAIKVKHDPATPAYGYRFDYQGRSITLSGDTAPSDNLAKWAKGSDILVHEGLAPELVAMLRDGLLIAGRTRYAKIMHDIPGYHTSPVDAARIANKANAKLLLFSHVIPPLPNSVAVRAFLHGVSDVRPDGVMVGEDGTWIRLPAKSDAIEIGKIE
ncbi:MAG: MBL fold metallo-hydrolase [Proteobacteria bacterium]|nr:MBL fold metallo-hydrolase [Pseudomonadota bacterium]